MGYLAADPETKSTPAGQTVTTFKVATNRDWKSSDGEKHEAADFHKIVAWRKLGEVCGEYLKKGSGVYLEGRLSNHSFKDKEGKNKLITEIVADAVNFISIKKNNDIDQINLVEVQP